MTSLTLLRQIKARPSIVFDALTTAEGMSLWWCPDEGPILSAVSDPRVGGAFRVRFRTLDNSENETSGEYLEFEKPHRITMSWRWTLGGVDPGISRVEIRLRAIAEGTELMLTHSRLHDEESASRHERGWHAAIDKLERSVTRTQTTN